MKIKKSLTLLLSLLLSAVVYAGLYHFCNTQTRGFRPYLILSNLPNDKRWELPPLSEEEQNNLNKRLKQTFTFLGSGGWCYAFLGEDQTTVLKFYKHTHLELPTILKELSFKKLLFISPPWPKATPYFQEFNFASTILLYKQAKERTGLLYVHLNKTQGIHPHVTLIDPIGVKHTLDLGSTEFVVQNRADLIIPHLDELMKKADIEKAKSCVKDMIACLFELQKKGIRDLDDSFRNNFGYIGDTAVALDLSSFTEDSSWKEKTSYTQEIRTKTKRLEHYLRKYHPALHLYYLECINQLPSKESL